MIEFFDIQKRFDYYQPGPTQLERIKKLREKFVSVALDIKNNTPTSREQSLALTKLEEAMMHANSAIVRNEDKG